MSSTMVSKMKKKIMLKLLIPAIGGLGLIAGGAVIMLLLIAVAGGGEAVEQTIQAKDLPEDVLQVAYEEHLQNRDLEIAELVAYEATILDGKWKWHRPQIIREAARKLSSGMEMEDILNSKNLSVYRAYYNLINAAVMPLIGEYDIETEEEIQVRDTTVSDGVVKYKTNIDGLTSYRSQNEINDAINAGKSVTYITKTTTRTVVTRTYGVKAFFPLPEGYKYTLNNDFGAVRKYGGTRKHQGNDIMAKKGVPIIAVEDGTIEEIGWSEFGGYRIGIKSLDQQRYYYYAHMLSENPYVRTEGTVTAGEVIGFVGASGYSTTEGTEDKFAPHLHFQYRVSYDISGTTAQVWIDPYGLLKFLERNRKAHLIEISEYDYTRDRKY